MEARKPTWKCSRQTGGVKCGAENLNRYQICRTCGKRKPKQKPKAHMVALRLTYEDYIALNGGEHCGICFRTRDQLPSPERRLDRDHDHDTHKPRGLLCREDNRKLKRWITAPWVAKVALYLERSEQHGR